MFPLKSDHFKNSGFVKNLNHGMHDMDYQWMTAFFATHFLSSWICLVGDFFFRIRSHGIFHHHFSPPFWENRFLVVLTTLSRSNYIQFFCQNLDRPLSFPCDAAFSAGPLRFACGTMTWMSLGTWTKCNQFLIMYIKFVGTLPSSCCGWVWWRGVLQHIRNAYYLECIMYHSQFLWLDN